MNINVINISIADVITNFFLVKKYIMHIEHITTPDKEDESGVIHCIKPFGVDVSSGVEKEGIKDLKMMKDFIDSVHNCIY